MQQLQFNYIIHLGLHNKVKRRNISQIVNKSIVEGFNSDIDIVFLTMGCVQCVIAVLRTALSHFLSIATRTCMMRAPHADPIVGKL